MRSYAKNVCIITFQKEYKLIQYEIVSQNDQYNV